MNLIETGKPRSNCLLACLKTVTDGLGRRYSSKHYDGGHDNGYCPDKIDGVASCAEKNFSEAS
jgi:hypothetical protein